MELRVTTNECDSSFQDDKKILKLDYADDCPADV